MNMFKRQNNFILIFLLISCITAMFGMGLEEHALSDIGNSNTSCISNQSFTTSDNITTIHVSEGNLALAIIKGIRNSSRQKSFGRNNVLLIFILTILSGVFRLTQEIYGFYHRLYIQQRYYLISYIHAKDGRKRLISCWWRDYDQRGRALFLLCFIWWSLLTAKSIIFTTEYCLNRLKITSFISFFFDLQKFNEKEFWIMGNILLWIVVILGGGLSLILCLYMIISMFVMIIYKIYRKIRYHASLYDWKRMRNYNSASLRRRPEDKSWNEVERCPLLLRSRSKDAEL